MDDFKTLESDFVYSESVRAGKRTYFFDLKSTKSEDCYLIISESRRVFDKKGNPSFEKHKLYIYKEDFAKFENGLQNALDFAKTFKKTKTSNEKSDIDKEFDDL